MLNVLDSCHLTMQNQVNTSMRHPSVISEDFVNSSAVTAAQQNKARTGGGDEMLNDELQSSAHSDLQRRAHGQPRTSVLRS